MVEVESISSQENIKNTIITVNRKVSLEFSQRSY
jgi:hypothetical protein